MGVKGSTQRKSVEKLMEDDEELTEEAFALRGRFDADMRDSPEKESKHYDNNNSN